MTSPGFPDIIRTCRIGPITVRQNKDKENTAVSIPLVTHPPVMKPGTVLPNECHIECDSDDQYIILYLSVATIGATILCLIFLTTTIIYCCKYRRITAVTRNEQRNITSGDGSEPVYVSLQKRPENEMNSTFMSVEDPNNPGNKVLMPKEVMDEFYRSLSLKKV